MNELREQIERRIRARASGRLRRLCVEGSGAMVRVTGEADSWHTKQLALQAAMEWLGPEAGLALEHEIAVRPPARGFERAES